MTTTTTAAAADAIRAEYAVRLNLALEAIQDAPEGAARKIAEVQYGKVAAERDCYLAAAAISTSVGYYSDLERMIEWRAKYEVLSGLAQAADYSASQGDSPEATWEGLREVVLQRVFGGYDARSSSVQSNEHERQVHWAWIKQGRERFGIARGW